LGALRELGLLLLLVSVATKNRLGDLLGGLLGGPPQNLLSPLGPLALRFLECLPDLGFLLEALQDQLADHLGQLLLQLLEDLLLLLLLVFLVELLLGLLEVLEEAFGGEFGYDLDLFPEAILLEELLLPELEFVEPGLLELLVEIARDQHKQIGFGETGHPSVVVVAVLSGGDG